MTKNTDASMKAAQEVLNYLRVTFPKRVLTNPKNFDLFMLEAMVFMENGPLEVRKIRALMNFVCEAGLDPYDGGYEECYEEYALP
tara:strand:- start:1118 stop:1372 length:255 start_codon:yes stop_codon:yes gene_type:complete